MIKPAIFALLAFLMVGLAFAAPPFEVQKSVVGLTIVYPETNLFKYGSNAELYFHVYNSNGSQVNATTVACNIDIYNKTNNHHVEDVALSSFQGHEFRYVLNNSKLGLGSFGYLVTCSPISGSGESGFVGGQFFLSTSGEVVENNSFVVVAILILLPLFFGWMLMQWCVSLGDDHAELKIFMSVGALMTVFISLWYGVLSLNRFMSWIEMQDAIGWTAWLLGIIFLVLLIYFLIYLIVAVFNTMAQKKAERLKY